MTRSFGLAGAFVAVLAVLLSPACGNTPAVQTEPEASCGCGPEFQCEPEGGCAAPVSCTAVCPLGLVCEGNGCVEPSCQGVSCSESELCAKGQCFLTACGAHICAIGLVCSEGACVPPSCVGVACPAGQRCGAGRCWNEVCVSTICPVGQVCTAGQCTTTACVGVRCGEGNVCAGGNCVPPGDIDGDGTADSADNCPDVSNASQENRDFDKVGDECDCEPENPLVEIGWQPGVVEVCGDGLDNDCDGKPDCKDEDCAASCQEVDGGELDAGLRGCGNAPGPESWSVFPPACSPDGWCLEGTEGQQVPWALWLREPGTPQMLGAGFTLVDAGGQWLRVDAGPTFQGPMWASGPDDLWVLQADMDWERWNGSARTALYDVPFPANTLVGNVRAVWGFSSSNIWSVGTWDRRYQWTGGTWNWPSTINSTVEWKDVWGVAPDDLWVVGTSFAVGHWNGTSWRDFWTPNGRSFLALHGRASSDVWVVGERGVAIHWTGGPNWALTPTPTSDSLLDVVSTGPQEAWALSSRSLFRWNGDAWALACVNEDPARQFSQVVAGGPNELYVYGGGGLLTWNGTAFSGVTFSNGVKAPSGKYWGQPDAGLFVVTPAGTLLERRPGAAVWTELSYDNAGPIPPVPPAWSLRALFSGSLGTWLVGDDGRVFQYTGTEWYRVCSGGGDLFAVWSDEYGNAWAAGAGGNLFLPGACMTFSSGTSETLFGLHGLSTGDNVWAVGESGRLVRLVGISNWVPAASPTSADLRAVWVTSTTDAWAAGLQGTLLRYNGSSWATAPSPTSEDLYALSGTAGDDVWVVGANGAAYHWDGGSWQSTPTGTTDTFTGVSASLPDDVQAVTRDGGVFGWNGTLWSLTTTVAGNLYGVGGDHIAVGGYDGGGFVYNSVALPPEPVPTPVYSELRAIHGSGASSAWAVGTYGLVLRWNGAQWSRVSGRDSGVDFDEVVDTGSVLWLLSRQQGRIYRWNGSAEVLEPSMTSATVQHLAGSGPEVWAVGLLSGVPTTWRWDGSAWNPQATNPIPTRGLWVAGPGAAFGLDATGVQRWNAGGWQLSFAQPGLEVMGGTSSSDIWAAGDGGTVVHWNGTTWRAHSLPAGGSIRALWAQTPGDVIAVTEDGDTLRYSP